MSRGYIKTSRVGEWTEVSKTEMVRLAAFDDLAWELDSYLSSFHVAANAFGGPVALCSKDPEKGREIALYNSMGYSLGSSASIYLSDSETLMFMCWNDAKDHLVVVLKDGAVRFYNSKGQMVATPQQVVNPTMCCATGNGVAIVLDNKRAVCLDCEESGEYRARVTDLPKSTGTSPSALLAIPSQLSDTGYCELFVAPKLGDVSEEGSIVRATFHSSKPRAVDLNKRISGGSIRCMALSPSASHISLITEDGSVHVCDAEFNDMQFLFNTETEIIPVQLVWCGNNALGYLHLARQFDQEIEVQTTLTIFDPWDRNNYFSTELSADVVLTQECDGIRILSEDTCQFLQVVLPEARRAFQLGSDAPAALLITAYDEYMSESAASVRIIRQLSEDTQALTAAINDCVATAGFEFDTDQQMRLMRIASFGKSFCPTYDTDNFVNMSRRLRVLHAVRKPLVGIAISTQQLLTLEGDRLSRRLVDGGHYQLAYRICEYLNIRVDHIMTSWASAKISSALDEKTIAAAIITKFKTCPGISFKKVAQLAHEVKKTRLAKILLEAETSASSQVETLLEIKEVDAALKKSIGSSDPDLVFVVLAHMIGNRGTSAVAQLISDPMSRDMLLAFCLACESRRDLLVEYYREHPEYNTFLALLQHLGEHDRLAKHLLKRNDGWTMLQERKISTIQSAEQHAKREPDGALKERLLRLHMELIDEQTNFTNETKDTKFLNSSVSETLRLLWVHGKGERADLLSKRFHVNDKLYCWTKLRALAQIQDWPGIDKLAGAGTKQKPPIGYSPFVRTLVACQRQDQAKLLVPKIAKIEERMELYLLCDDWFGAAVDCKKNDELGILEQLRDRAKGNQKAMDQIEKGLSTRVETSAFSKFFS